MARRDPLKFRTLEEWFALRDRVRDAHERSVAAKHEMEAHGMSRAEALRRHFSIAGRSCVMQVQP